jgi:S1-C subfamily serine protease
MSESTSHGVTGRRLWQESAMTGIVAAVLASLTLIHAPVPAGPPPDPLARGYMGIRVEDSSGLVIASVEPNGPALKAGLRPNDIIVRVGSLEPQEFKQVVAHVCSYRPGTAIEIEVRRGSERKVFKVKLTTRPADLDASLPIEPLPTGP